MRECWYDKSIGHTIRNDKAYMSRYDIASELVSNDTLVLSRHQRNKFDLSISIKSKKMEREYRILGTK